MGATIRVIVKKIVEETSKVKRFVLESADGSLLPAFSGGSHITTYLPFGDHEIERHYSLLGDPRERTTYQIAVRLSDNSRGGSHCWHHVIREKQQIMISYPKNHFPLSFRAKHHVFYAAGIGITPFLSMMADLQETGGSFELHYAARTKEECAFYQKISEQYPAQSHFYFSQDGQKMTIANLLKHRIGTHIYLCGPEQMITQFSEAARGYGYPQKSIHFERFTPQKPKQTSPCELILQKSGRKIQVAAEESLLDALISAGVKVPYSCRVGACGTCELAVTAGEVDHYDNFLSDSERSSNRTMLVCVSRAHSSQLVIDL